MKRHGMFLLALVLCIISSSRAGDIRYVVVSKTIGLRFIRYPLWEPTSGNKIGKLNVGTEVELVDSEVGTKGLSSKPCRVYSSGASGERSRWASTACVTG